jgi:catechol 2,3-dioxygenase-like lactoylglutathione lyase family enzyme
VATVRYIVRDVDEAVAFYTDTFGFALQQQFGPAMAIIKRGDLTLWLAGPTASGARPMPDRRKPEPGGWNRIVIEVDDIAALVAILKLDGTRFRNDIIKGPGGQQTLCEDPSGNPIEIFQPA